MEEKNKEEQIPLEIKIIIQKILLGYLRSKL